MNAEHKATEVEAIRRRWATPWSTVPHDEGERYIYAHGDIVTLFAALDAALAALDTEAEGEWTPVEDGKHDMGVDFPPLYVSHNQDANANTWANYAEGEVMLPMGYAICKRTPAAKRRP